MGILEHTARELTDDLRRAGLRAGSIVIVHSSLKSIGRVRGGPEAVIRAFRSAVGPHGTVLMPTFSYSMEKVYEAVEPFDPSRSAARTGLISETFRASRGVLRSLHPTHSVGVWGRNARAYVAGHEQHGAFDAGTPLHRAAMDDALVLMVGCTFTSLSLLHVAEVLADVPYLDVFCWWHLGWKPTAAVGTGSVSYPYVPGCSGGFGTFQARAERTGLIRRATLGNAEVLVFRAREVLDLAVRTLQKRPDALLCPPSTCRACDEKRVAFEGKTAAARRVRSFLVRTVHEAGIRPAGSSAERRAAELIAACLQEAGVRDPRIEDVRIPVWEPGAATLEVRCGDSADAPWQRVSCAPCAYAPPTRGMEASLVVIESLSGPERLGPGRGRIAVLLDGYGASDREFERLMAAGFGGFIYVDRRFCHADRVAVGFPATWIRRLRVPMVSVPFTEAARLFGRLPARARLRVDGGVHPGLSCNVVAEIPGTRAPTIVVCAHHDSTFNSPAVDDNLTGVAVLLEIARALARGSSAPRHTVRFCSFGAEELLSEGARAYALVGRGARDVGFVLNNDSVGSRMGSTDVSVTGPPGLTSWIGRRARLAPLQLRTADEISPFSDHFPFNAAGVPSVWFYRRSLVTGRHFHHTTGDGLAEVSVDLIAKLAAFQADLIHELAFAARWPFPARLPQALGRAVARAAADWLGRGRR